MSSMNEKVDKFDHKYAGLQAIFWSTVISIFFWVKDGRLDSSVLTVWILFVIYGIFYMTKLKTTDEYKKKTKELEEKYKK